MHIAHSALETFDYHEHEATGPAGVKLRWREQGRGETVLLLHGFSDCLETFWELGWARELAGDFRVVAFDARGHGRSGKPRDPASYGDELRLLDALSVLAAARADKVHVVGYWMGGWLALQLAVHAPERILSLAVGGAQPFGQSLAPLRDALALGIERWAAVLSRGCPGLSTEFWGRFARNDERALAALVADDRSPLAAPAVTPRTLWFTAEHDALASAIARASEQWSRGALLTLAAANHFDALLHPALLPALRLHLGARQPSVHSKS